MRRRDFLKQAGCFVMTAGSGLTVGCASNDDLDYAFPQGIASADPQPDAILLWTRVQAAADPSSAPIEVTATVATDEGLEHVVAEQRVRIGADSDHTLRLLVEGLQPATRYFYRFRAGRAQSPVGRTRTAPLADADVPVRLAWVSCQDFNAGFYGAYRHMIREDVARDEHEQIQLVLHVGDFIYETRNAQFQTAADRDLQPVELADRRGRPRRVESFPDGDSLGNVQFARTLEDYRHLYRTFLSDPDLQAARARWPFVCVWDDHEFSNDAWQTQANYTGDSTDEPSQQRKVAANRAWFEYVPALLSDAAQVDGVTSHAHDFEPVDVANSPYTAEEADDNEDNQAALSSLTIYRALRFGRHVHLLLTDNRSYRSDHPMPEQFASMSPLLLAPRAVLPLTLVNTLDAGRAYDGGAPEQVDAGGVMLDNPRRDSPPGSMLGSAQKRWLKESLGRSEATWKVWANSVPLQRVRLNLASIDGLSFDAMLTDDAWDGYNHERKELMRFLKDEGVQDVISLSGDHHAHFASLVMDDFDADAPSPAMVELTTAGISSASQLTLVSSVGVPDFLLPYVRYDARELGGSTPVVVNLNTAILWGAQAARVASETHDIEQARQARDASVNPHLRFVDTHAHGYGLLHVDAHEATGTLVTVPVPVEDMGEDGPATKSKATFTIPRRASDDAPPDLSEPRLEGSAPFPYESD